MTTPVASAGFLWRSVRVQTRVTEAFWAAVWVVILKGSQNDHPRCLSRVPLAVSGAQRCVKEAFWAAVWVVILKDPQNDHPSCLIRVPLEVCPGPKRVSTKPFGQPFG